MATVDSAGVVLFAPLNGKNYAIWSQRMKLELGGKGLLAVVTGKEEDKAGKDEQALIAIGKHVDDFHLELVMSAGGGRAAWLALEAMHRGNSMQRLADLRRQLNDLKKHAGESIVEYVGRVRALIAELALSGHKFENKDKELITAVLLGLPAEYETIVTVLHGVAQAAPMPVEAVLSQLMGYEARVVARGNEDAAMGLFAGGGRGGGRGMGRGMGHSMGQGRWDMGGSGSSGYGYGQGGHGYGYGHNGSGYGYGDARAGSGRGGFDGACGRCGQWGHKRRDCPMPWGNRGGRGGRGGSAGRGRGGKHAMFAIGGGGGYVGDDWDLEPDLPWGQQGPPQQSQPQQQQFLGLQYAKAL
jgi:hypothetical protein